MKSIETRLAALEAKHVTAPLIRIALVAARVGEATEDAVSRHVGEHGPLAPAVDRQINAIVLVPVAPAFGEPA